MPSENFQGNNERVLVEIRINHAMEHIGCAIIRTRCEKGVWPMEGHICNVLRMTPDNKNKQVTSWNLPNCIHAKNYLPRKGNHVTTNNQLSLISYTSPKPKFIQFPQLLHSHKDNSKLTGAFCKVEMKGPYQTNRVFRLCFQQLHYPLQGKTTKKYGNLEINKKRILRSDLRSYLEDELQSRKLHEVQSQAFWWVSPSRDRTHEHSS